MECSTRAQIADSRHSTYEKKLEAAAGFEPAIADLQSAAGPLSDKDLRLVLASCLAFLTEKMPDLASVIDAWNDLPDAVKAGILAMVKAVK